jgi:NAD(P)-dependent dehydrogenase (short-subunit alcohol dehydrogenase family)
MPESPPTGTQAVHPEKRTTSWKLTGTAALFIGASSGIGAGSRQLADHGASVALVARRALPEAITHLPVYAGWPKGHVRHGRDPAGLRAIPYR